MEPTPFWDRTDVNAVLWLILGAIIIVALCAVPPEWYVKP